ncbi:hypothetical protein [Kitasatospora phosalacinea]|uniref:Uncharacterized protein n=1 Tax=Kitasatospora phosalacinea TaxID=2065 RepID=A0A9W6PJN3_9ACTN|nr:hypothetical protein [Kitasatospora phosalacinea]GLW56134.1 hypothetical protein Kpho01_41450 [Kitasatospora phosalacinea]
MHILEDPSGLSPRALAFLGRAGRRQERTEPRVPTELLRVRDRKGRLVPAPLELVIRREGFAQRYGGLRYTVRESVTSAGDERRVHSSEWRHELGSYVWADPVRGWFFDWRGPHAAHPIRYLVHTDGRVGAENTAGDGVFQELEASMLHRIEAHALMDEVSAWNPWPSGGLGVARFLGGLDGLDGLDEVAEASGPARSWRMSATVAVEESAFLSRGGPRERRAQIWYRDEEGRRQVAAAAALAAALPRTA